MSNRPHSGSTIQDQRSHRPTRVGAVRRPPVPQAAANTSPSPTDRRTRCLRSLARLGSTTTATRPPRQGAGTAHGTFLSVDPRASRYRGLDGSGSERLPEVDVFCGVSLAVRAAMRSGGSDPQAPDARRHRPRSGFGAALVRVPPSANFSGEGKTWLTVSATARPTRPSLSTSNTSRLRDRHPCRHRAHHLVPRRLRRLLSVSRRRSVSGQTARSSGTWFGMNNVDACRVTGSRSCSCFWGC